MAFEQKVDATKKVAAQLVFEALKKHPGVKDRNQFYLQTNVSSSFTELEAVAATKQRWKGREGQVPMVGARAAANWHQLAPPLKPGDLSQNQGKLHLHCLLAYFLCAFHMFGVWWSFIKKRAGKIERVF